MMKNKKGVMNDVKKTTKMGKRKLSFSNCPTCYFLYMHNVSVAEIEYRQCFRSAYDNDLYVEDQSNSLYVINKFLK